MSAQPMSAARHKLIDIVRVDLITLSVVGISGGVSCLLHKVFQNIIPINGSTISSGCYPYSQMAIKF